MLTPEDIHAIAEELAVVLAERGHLGRAAETPARILSTSQLADYLGRSRDFVYDHADELGAFRMGSGPRAPLGFDRQEIDSWLRRQQTRPSPSGPVASSTPASDRSGDAQKPRRERQSKRTTAPRICLPASKAQPRRPRAPARPVELIPYDRVSEPGGAGTGPPIG